MELTQEQINYLKKIFEDLCQAIIQAWKKIKEVFLKFIYSIDFNKLLKIRKYQGIYIRTKSKRIKKKQLKLIKMCLLE